MWSGCDKCDARSWLKRTDSIGGLLKRDVNEVKEKVTGQSGKRMFQAKISNLGRGNEVTELILQRKCNLASDGKHILIYLSNYN